MSKDNKLQLFQNQKVRTHWDEKLEKWFFSVQDIVQILSESRDVKQYIKKIRSRNSELNTNWGTICTPVEMIAADGKKRKIQAADTEGILRIIQSIPSPKAEPFKLWLAKVGSERIDEIEDAALTFNMLAEASTTEISKKKKPSGLEENKDIARKGGTAAKKARVEIEKQTGESIVKGKNSETLIDNEKEIIENE